MAHLQIYILAAPPSDDSAHVEFTMDGLCLGTELVPSLALAVMCGCWDDPSEMVGKVFYREVE